MALYPTQFDPYLSGPHTQIEIMIELYFAGVNRFIRSSLLAPRRLNRMDTVSGTMKDFLFIDGNPTFSVSNITADSASIALGPLDDYNFQVLFDAGSNNQSNQAAIYFMYEQPSATYQPKDRIGVGEYAVMFDGYVSSVTNLSNSGANIGLTRDTLGNRVAPYIALEPPLCNHLPQPGTRIGNLFLEAE